MPGPKQRTHCKYGHPLTEESTYQTHSPNGTKNGRKCKECARRLSSKHRSRYPEKAYRGRIESQMKCRYGIASLAERDAILAAQGNKCAICETTDCTWGKGFNGKWHIDHRHDGTVNHRGILCARCNLLLGQIGDDVGFLEKVAAYLKKYQN